MNKKLNALIIEKGGSPYHTTWATYFMMDAFDSTLLTEKNNILSPTIAFVSTIQYTPISSQDMYNSLLKFEINDKNNINDFFKKIFKADIFNLAETAILAQMARNECKEGIKNTNENIIMQYVFRGFIILILTFPDYFREYNKLTPNQITETTENKIQKKDDNNKKIEDTFDWNLMSFIIKYLSNSNNDIHDAFLQSFEPLIAPYSKIESLLILPHDSPLFLFLLEIVQAIITFSGKMCQLKLYSNLEFVTSFFQFFLTTIKNRSKPGSNFQTENLKDDDNYYKFTSENTIIQFFAVFIQFLNSFQCKNVPNHLSNSLRITISTFLICFQDNHVFDENLFLEGIDSISLSAYLNYETFDDAPTILLFCQGIMTFMNWSSEVYKFDEVFKDIPKFEEKNEIMITEMPQSYFVSHRGVELHNKFTVSKTPKQCIQFSRLIQTLKETLARFSYFDFFIQSVITFYNHISKLSLIMLLISFPFSKFHYFDDYLSNFLRCLLSSDIFDISKTKVLDGLDVPLFDYSLNVFLNLFEIHPSFRLDILNFIFNNLEFKDILRILPLFRSLLLIVDQSNFISELLKTDFFRIVENNMNKPEFQREIDSCVAFVQVCVYSDPGLTMKSFNLTTFLIKCLPNQRYKERVMKCFKLGLAQKPPETIILLCLQISMIIRQSLEKKTDFELSSEFVNILAQYLTRFSLTVIEDLESKSIFDLISRLPYAMNNRECLLNVLRFFMILFSKFSSMNESLVRKNIYENLLNTFSIIPIDDEILVALLSLIMGNEVTLDDNGMNMMMNLTALKFITDLMKNTTNGNKKKYLTFLTNHCVKNAANCFFCFQSGVLDFTLDCFEIDSLHDISLNLFKIIASLFFSTRDLRSCAQTLSKYLDDDNNNHKKEICLLIEKLNEMLNETCYDNATSFFHFSYSQLEKITAEVQQDSNATENSGNSSINENSNLSLFSKSWVFSSTVSIGEFQEKMKIFSIKLIQSQTQNQQQQHSKFLKASRHRYILNRSKSINNTASKNEPKQLFNFVDCFFDSNNLSIQINNKETKKFKFIFASPYWYQIMIYFRGKEAILFIDQNCIETISFSQNISYSGEYEITIGGGFYGDIGDILIYQAPTIQSKEINFSELLNTDQSSSLQFYARNIDPHTKTLANTRTTNCTINCSYVPFRTTFKKCIISSITFSLFLPLLKQINDSQVLNLFLKFIHSLFACSKENETYFEKINGFPLFTGLIKNFEIFDEESCECLFNLFNSIRTDTLKNQMIEYLFLRFDLIFKFSDSFITKYFNKTIYGLFSMNKERFYNMKSLFAQMIYSTCQYAIEPLEKNNNNKEEENEERKNRKSASKYIDSIFNFFYELFDKNVSILKPIHDIFLVYLFCNDSSLKSNIINILNKYIINRKDQIICMLPEFKYFERFYPSIYSDNENEQKSALNLFTSLINLERSKEINTQTLIKVISYIQKNKTLSKNATEIAVTAKNEVKYPELVTVFCSGFPFSSQKVELNKKFYSIIEQKTLETFFSSEFSPFFMLAYCIDDIELWNTFTPIFIEKPDLLQKTLFTLNFFSLFVDNDCSPIKKQIFINVLRMALRKQPKTIKTIANVAVEFYCYRFYINDESTNKNKPIKYITNFSFEQVKEFMGWIFSYDPNNQPFSYNASLFEDEDYCYTLYQVLSDVVSQESQETESKKKSKKKNDDESESKVQITSYDKYPTFSIICVLVSYIIENSNDSIRINSMLDFIEKVCIHKNKEQINQVYYSLKKMKINSDSFHQKFPDAESDNSLKENFLIFIEDSKMTFKFEWQSPFNRFIKNAQQIFDKDPITNVNMANYESFISTSEEKISFVESYCKNLSLSFIREVKFYDSKGTIESKFRISNEVDPLGRRCYMSINKYFSDHRIASKNREDGFLLENSPNEENESKNITEIKRFLDRSLQQSISNIQYSNDNQKALLITLTGQYNVFYKFNQDSVVIAGKLAFNGFGSEINQDVNENGGYRSSEMADEEKAINNNSAPLKYIRIYFKDVLFIFNRRFLHDQTSCEIFTKNRKSYLLNFASNEQRNLFCSRFKCPENVPKSSNKNKEPHYPYNFFKELRRVSNGLYQTMPSSDLFSKSKIAEAWLSRHLSNYQYLYYLNILSGRSFNDASQYPVYPWIIKKYDTSVIDLYDQSTYRDLSIPMAAMDETRLRECQQKLQDAFDPIEKCMFRSFYSNSAIVTHFLIRCEPFTSLHILLQSGRFDYADRLFKSIESSFISSSSCSGDFSELLPEFFTNWHFLVNENGFDLGHLQNGQTVSDVILPKWARNACHFVETNRIALESDYVRCHLNEWIDLIFGCHQKSIEKNNLFHLFNYSDCITNQKVKNDDLISLAKHHALNFGCSPEKLLNDSHPVMQINVNFLIPESIHYNTNSINNDNESKLLTNSSDPYIVPHSSGQILSTGSFIASSLSSALLQQSKLISYDGSNEPLKVSPSTFEVPYYSESLSVEFNDYHSKLTMTKSFSNDNIAAEGFGQNQLPRVKPDLPNENIVFFSDMFYLTENGNFGKVDVNVLRKKYKLQNNQRTSHDNFIDIKNYGFITNIFGLTIRNSSDNLTKKVKENKNLTLNAVSDSLSDADSQDSLDSSSLLANDNDSTLLPFSAISQNHSSQNGGSGGGSPRIVVPKNSQTVFLKKPKIFVYIQANGSCAVAVPLLKSSFKIFDKNDNTPLSTPNVNKLIMHESSPISCICGIKDDIIVTGGSDCCLNVWYPPWDSDSMHSIPILSQKLVSVSGSRMLDRIVTIDESSQVFITNLSKKKLLFSFNVAEIFERERLKSCRDGLRKRKSSTMNSSQRIELKRKRSQSKSSFGEVETESDGIVESSHDELDIYSSKDDFDVDSSHEDFDAESSGDELDVDSDDSEQNNKSETPKSTKKKARASAATPKESSGDELDVDSDDSEPNHKSETPKSAKKKARASASTTTATPNVPKDDLDVDSDDSEPNHKSETPKSTKKKARVSASTTTDNTPKDEFDSDSETEYDYSESSHDELDVDSDQPPQNPDDKLNSSILCNDNKNNFLPGSNNHYNNGWKRISNFQILLLENSLILIASENADDGVTRIDLFDLTGKRVSSPISFDGEILKMIQAKNQSEISVILSMSTHHVYIINCHDFDVYVRYIGIFPELVCLSEKGESIVVSDSYRHLTVYDLCNK